MYCAVSMPTGPKPLFAERMVMLGFILISLRSFCWREVRFNLEVFCEKMSDRASVKWVIRESISCGRSGLHHDDQICRVLGSYVPSGLMAMRPESTGCSAGLLA